MALGGYNGFQATAVAGYTNLVNRIADGVGLDTSDGPLKEIAKHLALGGYNGFDAPASPRYARLTGELGKPSYGYHMLDFIH